MIQTFHYNNFRSIPKLLDLKKHHNESISIVIPARNEASTIGAVVTAIHDLKTSTGLVDEIVVMDDDSNDGTASIARDCGAKVVHVGSTNPQTDARGKGIALWKSQFVTRGSIIVFIDSDLLDFDRKFIIGLTGVLLQHRTLQLVKASYRRPLRSPNGTEENSGGRVTEILVRPLLNMFLPELGSLRQPLAGEYAIRRSAAEALPFYSGYAVEIGLLLECYFRYGPDTIGEVELGTRSHRNRQLTELSRMSFEIGQVFFNCLEHEGYCTINCPRGTIMKAWESGTWRSSSYDDRPLPPKISFEGNLKDDS